MQLSGIGHNNKVIIHVESEVESKNFVIMATVDIWHLLSNDEFCKQFIDKSGDNTKKIEALVQGMSVAEQIRKLSEVIALIDKELQRQVLENHEDLLSQASWVEKLEGILSTMVSHVQCLLSAVERLRSKVIDPFHKIAMQTLMLTRLHATSDLLRRVARIQHVSKRLNTLMQDLSPEKSVDIVKAAQCLCEINQLYEDVDLSGLEVLEEDEHSIRMHRNNVEKQAKQMLNEGLQTHKQTQVMTAVQVFYSLGTLSAVADHIVNGAEQHISKCVKDALDVHNLTQVSDQVKNRGAPGRAVMPSLGNTAVFRSRLWSSLENLFETIYKYCVQIELLERTMSKKVNDSMIAYHQNTTYLSVFPTEKQSLTSNLWKTVTQLLAKQLVQSAQTTSYLKQTLEGEYPKFLRLYLDLCKKLQLMEQNTEQNTEMHVGRSSNEELEGNNVFNLNRDVVTPFENAYLSCSVSRLLDPVNLMFSGDSVPSHEEVDALIRTITSELSVSLVDVCLSRTVARNISKTVRLFCLKCEHMVVTGGEATQVIDSCTPGQVLNASIANLLHYLNGQVNRVVNNMKSSLPVETMTIVQEVLTNTDNLIQSIINPILASISDAIEAIILTIHNEDYSMSVLPSQSAVVTGRKADAPCSLYMRELQGFIVRAVNNYLGPFQNQDIVSKCCIPVAGRCIELFLRHCCLARPVGDGGRMKLAADFAQLELAIAPLCRQVSELGQPYKVLRAFRPLLFMTMDHISSSSAVGDVVPHSLVLLSLFARGPPELPSPHQSANWSVSRFSQWLDSHPSEQARLEVISGALQRYQQTIRQRGETTFHDVYPVMVNLLERGIASCSSNVNDK